jgi:hypothetical protein
VAATTPPVRTVVATEHDRLSNAYPTDDEPGLVPVKTAHRSPRDRDHQGLAQFAVEQHPQQVGEQNVPAPFAADDSRTRTKAGSAVWQPRSNAFILPEEEQQLAAVNHDAYQRNQPLPGPVATETTNYQATRPQPTEQARQVILEWTRP